MTFTLPDDLRSRSAIVVRAAGYEGKKEDEKALAAGKRIKAGSYTRENLIIIFDWKTGGRGRSRLANNTDEEMAEALDVATHAKTDRIAIAALCGLHGVGVPVASAILTAIYPEKFTIIDFRALETLGVPRDRQKFDLESYLTYLNYCRGTASRYGVALRDLDRALWQRSRNESSRGKSRTVTRT
jgi:hypothetical protein